jgi:hypothetical protein
VLPLLPLLLLLLLLRVLLLLESLSLSLLLLALILSALSAGAGGVFGLSRKSWPVALLAEGTALIRLGLGAGGVFGLRSNNSWPSVLLAEGKPLPALGADGVFVLSRIKNVRLWVLPALGTFIVSCLMALLQLGAAQTQTNSLRNASASPYLAIMRTSFLHGAMYVRWRSLVVLSIGLW